MPARSPAQELRFAAAGIILAAGLLPWNCASAYTMKTLYSFCSEQSCLDGYQPLGDMALGADGSLYGVTRGYSGAIFRLTSDSHGATWTLAVLYRFCSESRCADGVSPNGGLILDSAGNLYGTTFAGGAAGGGIAFKLSPARQRNAAWTLQVLSDFCFHKYRPCTKPSNPSSGLSYAGAAAGVPYDGTSPLYGTTRSGGANDSGAAYRLIFSDGAWKQKLLYSFCSAASCADGGLPGSLLVAARHTLYGTTYDGGSGTQGTVFQLASAAHTWTETVLYNFCSLGGCADGRNPNSALVSDASGNLFGTSDGGQGDCTPYCGTLFRVSVDGLKSQETVLHNFCSARNCRDGALPSGIAMGDSGRIFGATEFGGANRGQEAGRLGAGTVFEFDGKIHQLYNFCSQASCADGEEPLGNLAVDPAGNIYGTTFYGGSGAYRSDIAGGTIFELVK